MTYDHSDSLPPHIAPLARASVDPAEDQFDAVRTLSEALIKSLGVLIYSDLNRTGLAPEVHVADGLGPLGTWHRLLVSLTRNALPVSSPRRYHRATRAFVRTQAPLTGRTS